MMETDTYHRLGRAWRWGRHWAHRAVRRRGGECGQWGDGRALEAKDAAQVDRHPRTRPAALAASDEGAPGDRGGGFYAAYFRDLDGNKLNAFFMRRLRSMHGLRSCPRRLRTDFLLIDVMQPGRMGAALMRCMTSPFV